MHTDIATGVVRSVVCVSVCAFGTRVIRAKTAKPIEMPSGGRGVTGFWVGRRDTDANPKA